MQSLRPLLLALILSLSFMLPAWGEGRLLPGLDDGIYWQNETVLLPEEGKKKPLIAIVIDDVGVDRRRSMRAVHELKAPITLSYLAYAPHVQEQVAEARSYGHEIMLHLPWEAKASAKDPGPHHLSVHMTEEQVLENLWANLDAFDGYVGVNNHMGSRFSRHVPGLRVVMQELRERGLFFLDSKTTPDSLAEDVAEEEGVLAVHRDVFLDHDENSRQVNTSLHEVEKIARRTGSVIAIGHPKDVTLKALKEWLPTVEAKGFELVPMSVMVDHRLAEQNDKIAHLRAVK